MSTVATKICRVVGCGRAVDSYFLCRPHREREKLYGDPEAGPPIPPKKGTRLPCKVPGCRKGRTPHKDFCNAHLLRLKRHGDLGLKDPIKAPRGRAVVMVGIASNSSMVTENPTGIHTTVPPNSDIPIYFIVERDALANRPTLTENPTGIHTPVSHNSVNLGDCIIGDDVWDYGPALTETPAGNHTPIPPNSVSPVFCIVGSGFLLNHPPQIKNPVLLLTSRHVISHLNALLEGEQSNSPEDAASYANGTQRSLAACETVAIPAAWLQAELRKAGATENLSLQEADAVSTEREPQEAGRK